MRRLDALQIPPCNLGVQFASSSFALILKIIVQFGYSKKSVFCLYTVSYSLQWTTKKYKAVLKKLKFVRVECTCPI